MTILSRTKLTALALSTAVFLTAMTAVTMFAKMPFGTMYRTLMTGAVEPRVAAIMLSGLTKPAAEFTIAEKNHDRYIILTLHDEEPSEATLTVPSGWHLEEVRDVHVQDIGTYKTEDRKTLIIPMRTATVELRFLVHDAEDVISFSHDATGPALVKVTRIIRKEPIQTVKIVEGMEWIEL